MNSLFEFFGSLGVFGWAFLILIALILLNIRKIFCLKSPLDSQEHKHWREKLNNMSIPAEAKHLEQNNKRK